MCNSFAAKHMPYTRSNETHIFHNLSLSARFVDLPQSLVYPYNPVQRKVLIQEETKIFPKRQKCNSQFLEHEFLKAFPIGTNQPHSATTVAQIGSKLLPLLDRQKTQRLPAKNTQH
jgi:hypothetical protein